MSSTTRTILFWLATAIFIFVAFLLVVLALGYGYNFSENRLVKTGAVSLSTNVSASVYINDRLRDSTSLLQNSFQETHLLPGVYTLRLESAGFRPWQKIITIQEGLLTNFPAITLVPNTLSSKSLPFQGQSIQPGSPLYIKNDELITFSNSQIISHDITTGTTTTRIKKVKNFHASSRGIDYVSLDGSLFHYTFSDQSIEPIPFTKLPIKGIVSFQIIGDHTYLIVDQNGNHNLYEFQDDTLRFIASNVTDFTLSPDEKKLLFGNNHELSVLYLTNINRQPYQEAGDRELITRTTQTITNPQWYKDSEHILVRKNDSVELTEIDNRGGRNTYQLIPRTDAFYYDGDTDNLYALLGKNLTTVVLP